MTLFGIEWAHPWFFSLLLLIPLLMVWTKSSTVKERQASFRMTTISAFGKQAPTFKLRLLKLIPWLRYVCIALLAIALARPQITNQNETINSEGIDIVLSIDVSGSMLAEDLKPNRIEAAKKVAADFVQGRQSDRIGLVIFAGESFTQTPITIDQNVLLEQLKNIKSGLLVDGTAIGMGLATAVDRLRMSTAKSKVIILMTDGVNNTGLIDPTTALEIAKTYKIRVYTIGVGTRGKAVYPVPMPNGGTTRQTMDVQIDEALLKKISKETGGKYYRATDNNSLKQVYKDIDQLEKSKVEVSSYKQYKELFYPFALVALLVLLLEIGIRYVFAKSITQ